jgi:hypothetical protein
LLYTEEERSYMFHTEFSSLFDNVSHGIRKSGDIAIISQFLDLWRDILAKILRIPEKQHYRTPKREGTSV